MTHDIDRVGFDTRERIVLADLETMQDFIARTLMNLSLVRSQFFDGGASGDPDERPVVLGGFQYETSTGRNVKIFEGMGIVIGTAVSDDQESRARLIQIKPSRTTTKNYKTVELPSNATGADLTILIYAIADTDTTSELRDHYDPATAKFTSSSVAKKVVKSLTLVADETYAGSAPPSTWDPLQGVPLSDASKMPLWAVTVPAGWTGTTWAGVTFTDLRALDAIKENRKITFGDGKEAEVYHDGSVFRVDYGEYEVELGTTGFKITKGTRYVEFEGNVLQVVDGADSLRINEDGISKSADLTLNVQSDLIIKNNLSGFVKATIADGTYVPGNGTELATFSTKGFVAMARIAGAPINSPVGAGDHCPVAVNAATGQMHVWINGAWYASPITPVRARYKLTSAQVISNNTWTTVEFNSKDIDEPGTDRQIDVGGVWAFQADRAMNLRVTAKTEFDAAAWTDQDYASMKLMKGTSDYCVLDTWNSQVTDAVDRVVALRGSTTIVLASGEYFRVLVAHDRGGGGAASVAMADTGVECFIDIEEI